MTLIHYLTDEAVTVPSTDLNRMLWSGAGYFEPGRSTRERATIEAWS